MATWLCISRAIGKTAFPLVMALLRLFVVAVARSPGRLRSFIVPLSQAPQSCLVCLGIAIAGSSETKGAGKASKIARESTQVTPLASHITQINSTSDHLV